MTPDQIIQFAREAELAEPRDDASSLPVDYVEALTRFAQLVASHKQEQCAKVCDAMRSDSPMGMHDRREALFFAANNIRALKD